LSKPETPFPPERATAVETFRAVERALSKAGEPFPATPDRIRDEAETIRHVPSSVRRVGAFSAGSTTWVWCQPREGARPTAAGQLVLALPRGRYLCDVLDAAGARWCSRESAGGVPLVIGTPALEGDVVIRIARVRRGP
jgi:hypothetical protein